MKEKWIVHTKGGDYDELGREYGISPVLARVLNNRGISGKAEVESFLSDEYQDFSGPEGMEGFAALSDIIGQDISEHRRIRVIGDYDIDGVCSTYILLKGLRRCGAAADHVIPHRVKDGYGLNDSLIENAHSDGIETIITCDNGISAAPQVQLAHSLGMKVIITDHHEIPFHMSGDMKVYDLPDADAIVDIKLDSRSCPYRELCGAAVALKVIVGLYERFSIPEKELLEFTEFAAFATVGDVMPLNGENRLLVKRGLRLLENTSNVGMKALIRAQGLEGKKLTPYHVGFILGPCINATGRLDTAENAFNLLNAGRQEEAESYAEMLKSMNDERRAMTESALRTALELADREDHAEEYVLVLLLPDCHESIAGIVAGKVRENTGKPVFVLTYGENCIKGSGRSIDGYDMYEGMSEVSDLFLQFGGHRMAGGLSIAEERVEEFRHRINENCNLTEEDIKLKVMIDAEMSIDHVNIALAEELSRLEPFGMMNPQPLFVTRGASFSNIKIFGKTNNVLKARVTDISNVSRDAVFFGDADAMKNYIESGRQMDFTYNVAVNEYRNNKNAELQIRNYR